MFWRSYICHPDLKRGHLGWDLTAGIKRQSCILSELSLCLFSFENLRRYLGHIILVSFFFWKFEDISGTHLRGGIWREALGDNPPRLDQRHCPLPSISLEWADLTNKTKKSPFSAPIVHNIISPKNGGKVHLNIFIQIQLCSRICSSFSAADVSVSKNPDHWWRCLEVQSSKTHQSQTFLAQGSLEVLVCYLWENGPLSQFWTPTKWDFWCSLSHKTFQANFEHLKMLHFQQFKQIYGLCFCNQVRERHYSSLWASSVPANWGKTIGKPALPKRTPASPYH